MMDTEAIGLLNQIVICDLEKAHDPAVIHMLMEIQEYCFLATFDAQQAADKLNEIKRLGVSHPILADLP